LQARLEGSMLGIHRLRRTDLDHDPETGREDSVRIVSIDLHSEDEWPVVPAT